MTYALQRITFCLKSAVSRSRPEDKMQIFLCGISHLKVLFRLKQMYDFFAVIPIFCAFISTFCRHFVDFVTCSHFVLAYHKKFTKHVFFAKHGFDLHLLWLFDIYI